jgi:hypothetical protein
MLEDRTVLLCDEQSRLVEWATSTYKEFTYNGNHNGYYVGISEISDKFNRDDLKNILTDVRNRIVEKENLQSFNPSLDLQDFLYVLEPGTKLHFHADNYKKSHQSGIHIRFNVCIQMAEEGGRPIYAGKVIDQRECKYIICRSELDYHASEWIKGDKHKIVASFGFMIDTAVLDRYSNREEIIETMCDVNLWKIENVHMSIDTELLSLRSQKYALDSASSPLGDFIKKTIEYHSNRLTHDNPNDHLRIEFSLQPVTNKMVSDYDKKNKNCPVLTILTFFSDEPNYIVSTNVDHEMYKYKEILDDNLLAIITPKKHTQIVFNSSNYFGIYGNSNTAPLYLKLNLWKNTLPDNCIPYISQINDDNVDQIVFSEIYDKHVEEYSGKNLVDSILYHDNCSSIFENIITKTDKNMIILHSVSKSHIDFIEIKNTYGDLSEDIFCFRTKDVIAIPDTNRFYKNKIMKNMLSTDVCYWIINETEKLHDWTNNLYYNYDKCLILDKLPHVLNFILFVSQFWLIDIRKMYGVQEYNINLNIRDIFVAKYSKISQYVLDHLDNTFFTLKIQLNNTLDFRGGEYLINGENIRLEQGDALLHSGKKVCNHTNLNEGDKYVLIMFIDIVL